MQFLYKNTPCSQAKLYSVFQVPKEDDLLQASYISMFFAVQC